MNRHHSLSVIIGICAIVLATHLGSLSAYAADDALVETTVTVDVSKTLRTMNPRRIGGTNIAMWTEPQTFASTQVRQWMAELRSGYIRLPGGSWANQVYWNGNGVIKRVRYEAHGLALSAKGTTLSDCSSLTFLVGDRSYEAEISQEIGTASQAGICLFYSERMFCGFGFSNTHMFTTTTARSTAGCARKWAPKPPGCV